MNIQTSIKTCFNKYATFSGRASRSEFWFFVLFSILLSLVTLVIDTMLLGYYAYDFSPINTIAAIITFLPNLAVACRRLHDVNRSGWWQLLHLTIIGSIVLLVWWITQGENKKNEFGPPINLKN